jgi:Transposase DDE domain
MNKSSLERRRLMEEKIIAIYCLCDDLLKAMNHYEDRQQKMTDAEVMTTALVAMLLFAGNFERSRAMLKVSHYIPKMLSTSRYNRRLHCIKELFLTLFNLLGQTWKQLNSESIYIIDSFPIAVCDNYRISRAKIYRSEQYRGYIPSKRRYFYGLRIHLMVTKDCKPVEFFLAPGCLADVDGLKIFNFDLPEGSIVYGDKAYNDYGVEDSLMESSQIQLLPMRKKNSKRALPDYVAFIQHHYRKMIETAGSMIEKMLPKSIHAVTAKGFELKVVLFIVAYSINFCINSL